MPAPRFRSRTFRRVFVKTPGGITKLHYRKRKPAKAQCAGCGTYLAGVANQRAHKMASLSKTEKRPERKFGGTLCTKCSRQKIKEEARLL